MKIVPKQEAIDSCIIFCEECETKLGQIVEFGEYQETYICKQCLKKALEMLEEE